MVNNIKYNIIMREDKFMYESSYNRHGQRMERKNNCCCKNKNKKMHNMMKGKSCKTTIEKLCCLGDNEICKIGSAVVLGLIGGITIKSIFDCR